MEMREIEAFLAVAEELHFGRAAERLMLSTSRVSHLVRTLERRAGVALFERTSRRVRLTAPGEQLFAELQPAYLRMRQALADVRRAAAAGGEVLRVGFATTLPERMAAELVSAFQQRFPGIGVRQSVSPVTDLFRWLGRDWPVDVFVTWMPTTAREARDELRVGPVIHRVPRAVLLSREHPLAARPVIDIEELAEHEVIYPNLPRWYGDHWVPPVTPAGRELRVRQPSAEFMADVLRVVTETGLAYLTFASLLEAYQRPDVVVVPLTGLAPMPVRAVWPNRDVGRLVHAFVAAATEHGMAAGWLAEAS